MENYNQCLEFAKKIRLEFPALEIFFPEKSRFLNLPPRNFFIFSREVLGPFGLLQLFTVHFVTDADLTDDDLLLPAANTPRKLEFRQLYIMHHELKVVIKKLQEICPNKSFENLYLGHCIYSESDSNKAAWGNELIRLIFKIVLHTISLIKKGRLVLEITDNDAEAFGSDLILTIKNLCINKIIESAIVLNHKVGRSSLLLEQEARFISESGKDLVDYVNKSCLKVISESQIFMEDIHKVVPGFHKRSIVIEEIISPPEWNSFSSEQWHL